MFENGLICFMYFLVNVFRNHTKSENRTVDHSLDPVPTSPFLPVSSASTSPALSASALRNGINSALPPALLLDDLDSRSPKPEPKARTSRKNGVKNQPDNYSTFITNKISAAGKKVKTTKELLEDIQARKSGKIQSVDDKNLIPKEDFLTTYDNKKKDTTILSDVIELNDSNSSFKNFESLPVQQIKTEVIKTEVKETAEGPVKHEPLEVILARLPPIDKSWMDNEEETSPVCTCSLIYSTPDVEVKMPSPPQQPKRSIFEMDYDEAPKVVEDATISSIVVPAPPLFEEKLDPDCEAGYIFHTRPADVTEAQVTGLHNCYISDVNGTKCNKVLQKETCKTLSCQADTWGQRPFYDCSRDLFLDVVPKYKYLDYSLDKCVKNLTKINLDKYEPVEANSSSREWLEELESRNAELIKERDSKTDDYHSPADSPFSEKDDVADHPCSPPISVQINFVISDKDNVNLDRDITVSNSGPGDDTSQSASNNNDPPFKDDGNPRDEAMECGDSVKSESCHDSQQSFVPSQCSASALVKKCSNEVRKTRRFTYGDSVMLLPLSIAALNASAGFAEDLSDNVSDLSCVFRTKAARDSPVDFDMSPRPETANLIYESVLEPVTLEMKDLTDGAVERLRRYGKIEDLTRVLDQSENATCVSDSPIWKSKPVALESNGALEAVCTGSGCPAWLDKLAIDDAYREWNEPVVRSSYNDEPLTILPYVVID